MPGIRSILGGIWIEGIYYFGANQYIIQKALIAAIASSLEAIINSASTIFSIDIYKVHFNRSISEEDLVKTGRISGVIIIALAASIASFLSVIEQVFQFIQVFLLILTEFSYGCQQALFLVCYTIFSGKR
jgi:uncharacterized sodium:solute symporter family permease YidK